MQYVYMQEAGDDSWCVRVTLGNLGIEKAETAAAAEAETSFLSIAHQVSPTPMMQHKSIFSVRSSQVNVCIFQTFCLDLVFAGFLFSSVWFDLFWVMSLHQPF